MQYLGGVVFTPNAFAIAPVVEEAKIPTVIFNAATSSVLEKSKYFVRTSYTLPGITVPIARFVLDQGVNPSSPWFRITGPASMPRPISSRRSKPAAAKSPKRSRVPLKTTDFAPFMQRAKGMSAQAMFMFFPGGPPSFAAIKAYKDNDLRGAGIRLFGTSEADEKDLPTIGGAALGLEFRHVLFRARTIRLLTRPSSML